MSNFFHRLIGLSVSVIILVFLLIFANSPLITGLIVILIALLTAIGVWEYQQFIKTKKFGISPELPIVFSIFFIASVYISRLFPSTYNYPLITLCLSLFFLWLYYFKEVHNAMLKIATSFFSICYVAVPLGMFLLILFPKHTVVGPYDGRLWIAYLIAVTKMTDVGAYIFGKLFKGKKLATSISPGKTVSGTVCGVFISLLTSLFFYWQGYEGLDLDLTKSIILGFFIAIVGQIGDLAESLLKRDAEMKDSNRLPGFGGGLDMLDSLLFTTPILYFTLNA